MGQQPLDAIHRAVLLEDGRVVVRGPFARQMAGHSVPAVLPNGQVEGLVLASAVLAWMDGESGLPAVLYDVCPEGQFVEDGDLPMNVRYDTRTSEYRIPALHRTHRGKRWVKVEGPFARQMAGQRIAIRHPKGGWQSVTLGRVKRTTVDRRSQLPVAYYEATESLEGPAPRPGVRFVAK
jgi:hypothetical protein